MKAAIELTQQAGVARVMLRNSLKFNAMSRAMWRELRAVFERLQHSTDLRCVVVSGAEVNFCSGGDISEYAAFRFQESSLRDFHENDVWPGLQAMLDCDVPIVAQIDGNCLGAGMEIASCCDIRLAGMSAKFGAPIARLGFPMAPRESNLVTREVGLTVARQMLLEAAILSATEMKLCGFLSHVVPDAALVEEAQTTAQRIAALAPQAARLNKQTLRSMQRSPVRVEPFDESYAYANSAEHREGIGAFLEKRKPAF